MKVDKEWAQKEVQKIVDKWIPILGIESWIVNVVIENKRNPEDPECEAEITVWRKYREASISVFETFWEFDESHQEKNLAHELCHILLWDLHAHLSPSGDDALEEAVQSVAMALFNLKKTKI